MMRTFLILLIALVVSLRGGIARASPANLSAADGDGTQHECPAAGLEAYTIRGARIVNPFGFLPWIRAAIADAERGVAALQGKRFAYAEVQHWRDVLAEINDAAPSEQRVRVSAVITAVENCADGFVDVVYYDFSSQIAPVLGSTIESRRAGVAAPETVAGGERTPKRFRLAPSAGYDRAEGLFGGGRFDYHPGAEADGLPLDSFTVSGEGSPFMHRASAALAGAAREDLGWLADAHWQLDYFSSSEPVDHARIARDRGAAQFAATTSPLGPWQLPLRFGAAAEGGRLDSDFFSRPLPDDTVRSSAYWSAKTYVGLTAQLRRHTLAASYGLELGSTGSADIDWIKHIGDVAHMVTVPVGDHRAVTVESRLTGGILQVPGVVPVGGRFFGGNREEPFIVDDAWAIRSNPVVRSVPANRFSGANRGPGGTKFVSYNLTVGLPIWRIPLVPLEASRDPDFREQVAGGIESATNTLQQEFAAKDPAYERLAARVPEVAADVRRLEAAVSAAQSTHPTEHAKLFHACSRAITMAKKRADAAATSSGSGQLGRIAALLSADETENRLAAVHAACAIDLNAELHDQAIAAAGADLERIHLEMEDEFAAIDQENAHRQAESEMRFVHRIVAWVIDEANVVAIGPVLMFDVAHIDPAASGYGTRYGVGAGLRLTLVDYADFTAGYVANPYRRGNEPPGAPFFAIEFRDVLN